MKKVIAIHDISGFGRCSLTVALPILSVMGHQCAALPAAYLSTHTGYEGFTFLDMTPQMVPALDHWKHLGLQFDAIYSGFLGSDQQMQIVSYAKSLFPNAILLVDPVMGDHGKRYATYTDDMCKNMTTLASKADIIVPNLTEAAILLNRDYKNIPTTRESAFEWLEALSDGSSKSVVLTGLELGKEQIGFAWLDAKTKDFGIAQHPFRGRAYHGTGDVFASVFLGSVLRGKPISESADAAALFVGQAAGFSFEQGNQTTDGVCFESLLGTLATPI